MYYLVDFLVNCLWSEWEEWSSCSRSCNGGKKTSNRTILQQAKNNGTECQGNDTRIEKCNSIPCPGTLQFDRNARVSINFVTIKTTT